MTAVQVLADHQLGFMGACVDNKGLGGCDWKAKRPVERHGAFDDQHREHVAEMLAAVVSDGVRGGGGSTEPVPRADSQSCRTWFDCTSDVPLRHRILALADEWEEGSANDHDAPCHDEDDCARCCARDLRSLLTMGSGQ